MTDIDRYGQLALLSLSEHLYDSALKYAQLSKSSEGRGAGVLAARALASETDDRKLAIEFRAIGVELAFSCKEDIPRAQAAFDAWLIGTEYAQLGNKRHAVVFFRAAMVLGYSSSNLLEGFDALDFAASEFGIDALDDRGEEINHSVIRDELDPWQGILERTPIRRLLDELDAGSS